MTPKPEQPDLSRYEPLIERIVQALTAPKADPGPRFVTAETAADLLGLNVRTVKRLRKDGKLASIRDGQRWMYLRSSVEEWKP